MEERIIVAGFGGQGVQSLGELICHAGMMEGRHVTWLPSYGPEMRGGTTNCSVIISDSPVGSPMVDRATCAMVLNLPSLNKFESMVEPGKLLFINKSLINRETTRNDVKPIYVECTEEAIKLGNARVGNMVMLGAYIHLTGILKVDSVMASLPEVLGPGKEHLISINRAALERGAELV